MLATSRVLSWAGALAGAPAFTTALVVVLGVAMALLVLRIRRDRRRLASKREQARAALDEVLRIGALASAFSAATKPAEVAEVAFRACRGLGATHASIGWIVAPGEVETLHAFGHDAIRARWHRYRVDASGPNADALRTATPIVLETPGACDAAYPAFAALRTVVGVGAWISWPLVLRRGAQGVLGIGFGGPRVLTRSERTLLGAIAEHAAQALERARLLDRAEESERRFRLLADNAPDVVYRFRLRPSSGLEYVSPSTTRLLGYTPEEHYADPELIRKIVIAEDLPKLEEALRGETEPLVLRWRRRDGKVVWAEHRNVVLDGEDGLPVAIEGIARDITERMEMEAERERLVCEREDLLRAVSHDFRTPLQAVLLRAESLAREPTDPSRTVRSAHAIAESARRMSAAVQDVLHLARLSPGGLEPRPQPIPLGSFLEDLAQRLFTEKELARLELAVDRDAAVRADPDHLERILTNLVGNALKYSDAPARVTIATQAAGADRLLVVSDEGPGIAAEDLPRLFERYFRGSRPSGREGTGLGLYVTRILAEAQGGAVSVESSPGKGAVFKVRLPAAPSTGSGRSG